MLAASVDDEQVAFQGTGDSESQANMIICDRQKQSFQRPIQMLR